MAEITNASKSPKPIRTDIELLSLFRKRAQASKTAAVEFEIANRKELQEKEIAQSAIFDEYALKVDVVREAEMEQAIADAIPTMIAKRKSGTSDLNIMLKILLGPRGSLSRKPVDRASLADLIKNKLSVM